MSERVVDLSALNVLLIDGNRHSRWLMKEILRSFGIRNVREADDGADGLKVLKLFAADIVITELMADPLNGIDFVKLLRNAEDSPNPFLPVVMVSAYTEKGRVMQARDAGITEFLAKPFSATGLYQRLKAVALRPRPFVRTKSYFGPDRRRKAAAPLAERERRAALLAAIPLDQPLTEAEIALVMEEDLADRA